MPSAPAKGTRVGLRSVPNGRWLPMIAHTLRADGTVTFRWPDRFGRGERVLAAYSLKHTDWEWKPADQCTFVRACAECSGYGAHQSVMGTPTKCKKCRGEGSLPDRRPFE